MKLRPLPLAGVLVVVAAALWAAAWFLVAGQIRGRLDGWIEARRADGFTAEHTGIRVAGFPFVWRVIVAEAVLVGPGAAGWAWHGQVLEAEFAPTGWRDIAVRFPGDHHLSAKGGALGGTWKIRAGQPDGRILLLPDGRLDRLDIDFRSAEIARLPDGPPVHAARIAARVTLPRPDAVDHRAETFLVTLGLENVTPVEPPIAALGTTVSAVQLDLAFKGQLPRGRLAEALAAWRDDGGTLEINHAALAWGPIDADGSGTLALDSQNRPLGAFTLRLRGYNETIDALQAAGQIPPWPAAGAKMALGAIARQQPNGTRQVEIPLTAQDGRLYVVGLPLMRLAPLRID